MKISNKIVFFFFALYSTKTSKSKVCKFTLADAFGGRYKIKLIFNGDLLVYDHIYIPSICQLSLNKKEKKYKTPVLELYILPVSMLPYQFPQLMMAETMKQMYKGKAEELTKSRCLKPVLFTSNFVTHLWGIHARR